VTCIIEPFTNGRWRQNCYIVGSEENDALIIDPGSDAEAIVEILSTRDWRPLAIINTHAHYDHIGAVASLMEQFNVPFYLHGGDIELLRRANLYRLAFGARESVRIPDVSHDLGECSGHLTIGSFELAVFHTPGHTEGGVCFQLADNLFSGDTLMASGRGRIDLPGGGEDGLDRSLEFLSTLDGSLAIHGGHGPSVTLADALATASSKRKRHA
jgi:hydroxyacylglutathione hydrolase